MKCHGLAVTSVKVDPYLNIDAGTFNPYEHGEVYVLDDGAEVRLRFFLPIESFRRRLKGYGVVTHFFSFSLLLQRL